MNKIICTICARGGSQGVKNKNIRPLCGKPLIQYTIEQAIESNIFDEIAVSSDSHEILKIAEKLGVKNIIKRPDELASNTAGKINAIIHCIDKVESKTNKNFDLVVDLDCTAPLRHINDIKTAIKKAIDTNAPSLVTATPARKSPYFNLLELEENGSVKLSKTLSKQILRRQDSPKCYDQNGSIYVWKKEILLNQKKDLVEGTQLYEMPEERGIDIDTELDFIIAEILMSQHHESTKN